VRLLLYKSIKSIILELCKWSIDFQISTGLLFVIKIEEKTNKTINMQAISDGHSRKVPLSLPIRGITLIKT
jgi:hypothetical protein